MSRTLVDICDRIAAGHQVCLDLDFDFFFDREHATVDSWQQKRFDNYRFEGFLKAHDFAAFSPIVGHDEALQQWIDKPLSGAICVHIDFHHDWYIDPQKLDSASLQHLDSLVTCGNYLAIAAKAGLISQLVWIYPDGFDDATPPDIGPAMAQLGVACVFISYSDYCRHLLPVLRDATIVSTVAALSPDFVSGESLSFFFSSFDCDAEFRYRALDYAYEKIVSSRRNPSWKWYRKDLSAHSAIAFHGSPHSGLQQLTGTGDRIFVSPSLRFSVCYETGDLTRGRWGQGVDLLSDDPDTVIIQTGTDHAKQSLVDMDEANFGSTYAIATVQSVRAAAVGCLGHELLMTPPLTPAAEYPKQLPTAAAHDPALLVHGIGTAIALPDTFNEFDWSEFTTWMSADRDTLLAYRSTPFFMTLFQLLRGAAQPPIFFPLVYWRRLAERALFSNLPADKVKTDANGYHGLEHALEVAYTTLLLAHDNGTNPVPGFLAALMHDLSDSPTPDAHTAHRSAQLVALLLDDAWLAYAGQADAEIVEAIQGHSAVTPPPSEVAAFLRDADRLRLAWERGYKAQYFSTGIGHELAQLGADYHAGLIRRLSFDTPVNLELDTADNSVVLTVWTLGRRYRLGLFPKVSTEMLNWHIAWLHITAVYDLSKGVALAAVDPRRLIGGVKLYAISATPDGTSHMFAGSLTALQACIATRTADASVQYVVSCSNFDCTLKDLPNVASQGCNLVFADNSPLASKRLSILADALDAVKSRNADAVSCRIITHLPWCHVSSVNCAIRVLAKAQDAYAPGIGAETRIVDNPDTLFDAIIAEEREKYDLCGRCAFSLNCIGLPAPRTDINDDSMFEQIPVSYDEFKSWDFYEAF